MREDTRERARKKGHYLCGRIALGDSVESVDGWVPELDNVDLSGQETKIGWRGSLQPHAESAKETLSHAELGQSPAPWTSLKWQYGEFSKVTFH